MLEYKGSGGELNFSYCGKTARHRRPKRSKQIEKDTRCFIRARNTAEYGKYQPYLRGDRSGITYYTPYGI